MPGDLSEVVMPKNRPTKVIHFQPMSNIFLKTGVPKFHAMTPWKEAMASDPFQNLDEVSRNWLYLYRLYNSNSKYVCNFSVPDKKAYEAFMTSKGLSPVHFQVEDWRRLLTPLTDEQLVPVLT